mmetsp:Transcript_54284/g.176446  ORF Transcript_54284/g.176446 Transcript_54284/m.176446 type:complete len:205 (+) Transcript_54284:2367-2981(+)
MQQAVVPGDFLAGLQDGLPGQSRCGDGRRVNTGCPFEALDEHLHGEVPGVERVVVPGVFGHEAHGGSSQREHLRLCLPVVHVVVGLHGPPAIAQVGDRHRHARHPEPRVILENKLQALQLAIQALERHAHLEICPLQTSEDNSAAVGIKINLKGDLEVILVSGVHILDGDARHAHHRMCLSGREGRNINEDVRRSVDPANDDRE